ncbi:16504_t:CDS:2 [Acaulospora morrowiae]|uniref:16504_t:CDS:1 n=1 Tax=Acaulospora morrowiae TaxID=94023 RepID=A0A9N9D8D6_9GLOM|nr:16504_t:CDS:2 [Acaulospora morrowiae]
MASSKGTDKVLEKINESVESGNYYEAHQMYRTVCRRYAKQKKYNDAINLLFPGVQILLKHMQSGSGSDLTLYMIDVYNEAELQVSDESRDRIIQLLELFPPDEPGRKRVIDSAISWSTKFGENPAGDPKLHQFVAELLWKDKKYSDAEPHFLAGASDSSKLYGRMLVEWSEQDHPSKRGAYIARAVLQYLCLRSIRDAKIAFESFISEVCLKDPSLKAENVPYRPTMTGDPVDVTTYRLPLLNFLQLLILTVQREASDLFVTLRNKYKSVLSVEPMFEDLLNKIGETFFNIRALRPPQFNIFQDIMNSLLAPPGGGSSSPAGTSHTRTNLQNDLL